MGKKKDTKQFIREAICFCKNDMLDFSLTEYVKSNTKVKIICHKKDKYGNEHGVFEVRPNDFFNGHFCPKCGRENQIIKLRSNTEDFVKKCKFVHKEDYDYSKVEYVNSRTKVCLICPIHGDFLITPSNYLSGCGCPACGKIKAHKKHNEQAKDAYIKKAYLKHNGYYIYDETIYNNSRGLIDVICPKHGKFSIKANSHLNGNGCRLCAIEQNANNKRRTLEEFIKCANVVHGGKYKYNLSEYIDSYTPTKIVCPKHGMFRQMPYKHLYGEGCPHCNQSHLERMVEQMLIKNDICYVYQKRFSWLMKQSLDFYLPEYNVAIECQGIQHFKPLNFFGDSEGYTKIVKRDERKYKLVTDNGIRMIYFAEKNVVIPNNYMENYCITDLTELLNTIYEKR